jgi:ribose transport system substrate-binding protein
MSAILIDLLRPKKLMGIFVGAVLVLTAGGAETTLGAQAADTPSGACGGSQSGPVAAAFKLLTTAQQHSTAWDGPTTGPKALPDKLVVYVAQDMRNGGVLGVSEGVQGAAAAIGWRLKTIDGVGSVAGRVAAINQAVALRPDGLILGSVDAQEEAKAIRAAAQQGVKIVGWHSAAAPGPVQDPPIFANVTTEAVNVAKVAAAYALQTTNCAAGAVIFWQSGDAIGIKKAETMRDVIQACSGCKLLDYVNTPLADTAARMPQNTTSLLQRFGKDWTIGLGINDLYFDFASPSLRAGGVPSSGPPTFISAGDGSVAAFNRVRSGEYQIGTVAEPLHEAGWQLIDELNRALAGQPPSGYVAPVHLVTKANIMYDAGPKNIYDPDNSYQNHYKSIWGKEGR